VTDASAPASVSPGVYHLGRQTIRLTADRRVVTRRERLAGSALRMDEAIGNVMRLAGTSLADALTMVTTTPARVGRVPGRTRGLRAGDRADLVRFAIDADTGRVEIQETYVSGTRVFRHAAQDPPRTVLP
jgi:N-acetylglucosamine-6-phosphate deacetylase